MAPVSPDDYTRIAKVSMPAISPDGEHVAFVKKTPTQETGELEENIADDVRPDVYEASVWISSVDGGETRRYTIPDGLDSEPRWDPTGEYLAFVTTRDQGATPELWLIPTAGGEARRVTDVPGAVEDVSWSPDGTKLSFTQETTAEERERGVDTGRGEYTRTDPDPKIIDRIVYRTSQRYFDGKRNHVYVLDLDSETVERITEGDVDNYAPSWGDSSTLYYTIKRPDDVYDEIYHEIVRYDLASDSADLLATTTDWEVTSKWGYGPGIASTGDGRVAYTRKDPHKMSQNQTQIEVLDESSGETTVLTGDLDRTILGNELQWGPDEEFLYFYVPDEGNHVINRARPSDPPEIEPIYGGGDDHITGFDVSEDYVAVLKGNWDHPGDVFVHEFRTRESSRLTRVNREYLEDVSVSEPEEIWFENDDFDVQGWVLTPPGFDPAEEYPLIVNIHGGPHVMWTTSGTMWHEFQSMAARGYVVFWCNFRGSTGYGQRFQKAIEGDWGAGMMTDIMAGVDHVSEREYVDEDNLFVTGGSGGGFMTTWIIGHTDRFAAAVPQRGVFELNSWYGSAVESHKYIEWEFQAVPWEDTQYLWEQSPIATAHEASTPTLIIHGDNDFATRNNSEMLYRFLKKNRVPTRMVRYPREGHELSRSGEPGHVIDRIDRIVRWFDGYSDHHDAEPVLE